VAAKFLRGELKEEALPAAKPEAALQPAASQTEFQVDVDGELFNVRIYPVSGALSIKDISTIPAEKTLPKDQKGGVLSPLQGMVLRLLVKPGDRVEKGKPIAMLEAMKMEVPVESPHAGEVREIFVFESEMVDAGDLLMIIR
jgi:pyruvate carboxylase subunit B